MKISTNMWNTFLTSLHNHFIPSYVWLMNTYWCVTSRLILIMLPQKHTVVHTHWNQLIVLCVLSLLNTLRYIKIRKIWAILHRNLTSWFYAQWKCRYAMKRENVSPSLCTQHSRYSINSVQYILVLYIVSLISQKAERFVMLIHYFEHSLEPCPQHSRMHVVEKWLAVLYCIFYFLFVTVLGCYSVFLLTEC